MSLLGKVVEILGGGQAEADPQILGRVASRDHVVFEDLNAELQSAYARGEYIVEQPVEAIISEAEQSLVDETMPATADVPPARQHMGELIMFDAERERRLADARDAVNREAA